MRDEDLIILGEMVDLIGHRNRLYRTKVEDMLQNGLYLVGVPRYGGTPMPLHADEDVFLIFYRETGRFIVQMSVVGFEKKGEVRYVWLFQKSEPYKDQRREAFRVHVSLNVHVYEYQEEAEDKPHDFSYADGAGVMDNIKSRDLSVSGISILSKNVYQPGDRHLLKVHLFESDSGSRPFITNATVARSSPWRETGKNNVGLNFFGHTKSMREFISKYVLEEQRKQLRQRRLLEG